MASTKKANWGVTESLKVYFRRQVTSIGSLVQSFVLVIEVLELFGVKYLSPVLYILHRAAALIMAPVIMQAKIAHLV